MMKKTFFAAVVGASAFMGGTAAHAGGAVCAVVDSIWSNRHGTAESGLIGDVNTFATTVANENLITYQQLMDGLGVLTAQQAATDNQIATTDLKANEANANAIAANMSRLAIASAYETYGDAGQPPDACGVVERLSDFNQAVTITGSSARAFVTDASIDVRAGGVSDMDAVISARLSSASPVTLDVMKSLLDPNASDAEVAAFVNNLTGLPMEKIGIGDGGAAAGAGSAAAAIQNTLAMRMEAYRSPALFSLGYIRAIRAGGDGGHTPSEAGIGEHLEWIKARYGGGPEHERWAANMATKAETGILKEVSRIRQLSMAVRNLREESVARMTVLTGAMVAQEAAQ